MGPRMHGRTQPARAARPARRAPPPRAAPRPSRSTRRAAAAAAALGLVLAGGRGAREAAAGVHPRAADATALAAAFAAAWAAHDLEAVVALFADDAVVRQRGAEIAVVSDPLYGPSVTVRDAFGVGLDYFGDPPRHDPDDPQVVTWAAVARYPQRTVAPTVSTAPGSTASAVWSLANRRRAQARIWGRPDAQVTTWGSSGSWRGGSPK